MKLDFSGVNILVIGDPMLDIYHFGHVDRISPEAPVPVFIEDRVETRMGGAANVSQQLWGLGCKVSTAFESGSIWTQKHRYMVGSHQLFRTDGDAWTPNWIPALDGFHAIVISDYAKGACTPEICQEAVKSGLPVIVDPKGIFWSKYRGAKVICPNHLELYDHLTFNTEIEHLVVKKGNRGISLHSNGDVFGMDFPSTARHVFDVTGAGDTVTAVIAACVASKIDLPTACKLANLAAGFVVGEVGTSVCPIEKLRELACA